MSETLSTGTVYALVDPRDDSTRYIGQTTKALAARLRGHLSTPSKKVRPWITELRGAALIPKIVALRTDVPARDLLEAEREEITKIIAAGGTLLNEQSTALGRSILGQRQWAERIAAEQAGWAEIVEAAFTVFGGPLPPGDLPSLVVPSDVWTLASIAPGAAEAAAALLKPGPRPDDWYRKLAKHSQVVERAEKELEWWAHELWPELRWISSPPFAEALKRNLQLATTTRCASQEDAGRLIQLICWYMVNVYPWRHLAHLAGQPADDAAFIAWAGRDPATRDALAFLADHRDGMLAALDDHCRHQHHDCAGAQLGATAAAYTDRRPSPGVRETVIRVLVDRAKEHLLTQPMAALLTELDSHALDEAFGRDITALVDVDLGLSAGTSGQVLRAVLGRLGYSGDPQLRQIADRSTQMLPVTALPDCLGWTGQGVVEARSIAALLVHSGLAAPDDVSVDAYMRRFHGLWTERREQPLAA